MQLQSLHEVTWACMQFPELALQFPELHEVRWAYMKLHELVCSSFLCLSSSQEFRSACLKEKPSKQRNKHSLETEVLNQVVTIWLGWINLLFYNVCNTTSQIVTMVHVEAACQVWHVAKAIFASFQPFFPSSSIILIFGIGLMYPQDCQILVDDFRHQNFAIWASLVWVMAIFMKKKR